MNYVLEKAQSAYAAVSDWADAKVASVVGLGLASASAAMAEVPAGVTTAIDGMKADAITVGGAILVAIVAVMAFKFIRKAM